MPETTQKYQMTTYDMRGNFYKTGLYKSFKTMNSSFHRQNAAYGGGLRREFVSLRSDQNSSVIAPKNIGLSHCFCPDTPLFVSICARCGKSPYTD